MTIERFDVLNRWTNAVQFTAEIEVTPDMTPRVKLGLAVRWGHRSGAVLRGAVLSGVDLSDVDLRGADLRGAVLSGAVLRGAVLSGVDLSDVDLSGADLSGAVLSGAVLSDVDLRGADLRGAVLRGADLRGADLRGADLRGADLRGAVLRGAVLSGAVLRGAVLSGAPIIPQIHQKIYEAASQSGALDMRDWHTCETTHCRAGWAVFLAGAEGAALEAKIGTPAAATLIYLASDPTLGRFPSFYCTDEDALADMKRLAELEARP